MSTTAIETGTILRASWGYDQTNIDYFEVVSTSAQRVQVRPIAQRTVTADTSMSEWVEPLPGEFTGPAISRKPIPWGESAAVRISSCAYARIWEGKPDRQTHYA